jgi:hypothetical protein
LSIRREVLVPGYVSCDTHVHTFTHSRHGDAAMEERMRQRQQEGQQPQQQQQRPGDNKQSPQNSGP